MLVLAVTLLVFSLALITGGVVTVKKSAAADIRSAGRGMVYSGMIFTAMSLFVFLIQTDKVICGILLAITVALIFAFKILTTIIE